MKGPEKIYATEIDQCGLCKELFASYVKMNQGDEYIRKDLLENFADAVRRYVNPRKGDAFCSRSELLQKLNELQKLME